MASLKFPIAVNDKFDRLTVVAAYDKPSGKTRWLCLCKCGKSVPVYAYNLTSGNTGSCGCLHLDMITKHGDYLSVENGIWKQMNDRCSNPNNKHYIDYGGRGIKVCDRWTGSNGYQNFLTDVGRRPGKIYSIERIDNNGNYEFGNVKWATREEQMRNTRRNHLLTSANGETKCLKDWADTTGKTVGALYWRLKNWPMDRVLESLSLREKIDG